MLMILLSIIGGLGGLGIIICICLQTASPDAGFSAAMGGGGGGGSRKGGHDLLLERVLKISAVVWIMASLALAIAEAHGAHLG
jgi:preprotein translocase subunit SecG